MSKEYFNHFAFLILRDKKTSVYLDSVNRKPYCVALLKKLLLMISGTTKCVYTSSSQL